MKLSKVEKEVLKSVKEGADVWGYGEAKTCRQLETKGLVKIVRAMNAPRDGAKQQPYFGCIAVNKN